MTPEERQMLGGLFQRVNSAAATQRDPEAKSLSRRGSRRAPLALCVGANGACPAAGPGGRGEPDLPTRGGRAAGRRASQEHGSFLGNLGKSIFGGGPSSPPPRPDSDPQAYQRAAPPPPRGYAPPQGGYPPPPPQGYPPQPGPWGQPQPSGGGGGGFLQNAASTATGVAGGVVLGNLLGGLFGGHSGGGGGLFGGASATGSGLTGSNPTEVTEINNYYDDKSDRGSDANFDPGTPNFDNLDNSTFDNSDGSSDDGGGGYDDV